MKFLKVLVLRDAKFDVNYCVKYNIIIFGCQQKIRYIKGSLEPPAPLCQAREQTARFAGFPAFLISFDAIIRGDLMVTAGFSKEITMVDYGFTKDADKFVAEIQMLVESAI